MRRGSKAVGFRTRDGGLLSIGGFERVALGSA